MVSTDTISDKLKWAGVPSRYLAAEPRPDLLGGAYIYGAVGTGKTHAACGALRAYVERRFREVDGYELYDGDTPRFVNAPKWFAELRDTYSTSRSEQDVFDRYAKCGLLVLDDLGKGSRSEWAAERLYMLLDERYSEQRPTIITSNYDVGKVAALLASDAETVQAIASRIIGLCDGLKMTGEDRRKKS